MKKVMLVICFLLPLSAFSINISVRIYETDSIKTILLAPKTGAYLLFGNHKFIDSLKPNNIYEVKELNNQLIIKNIDRELGKYNSIQLKACNSDCSFNIKPSSEKYMRLYDDNLEISNDGAFLKLLNTVELEHYIAGVVECEGGYNKSAEFYKAQAIICRTYALNNLARHLGDYYELCDAVHCQVYKGAVDVSEILNAVEATTGLVIADSLKRLINAAYCSNCGGYTINSEDVWNTYAPYLRAIKDTFCLNQLHAKWEKLFDLKDWTDYLNKKEATLKKTDTHGESYWDSIPEEKRIYFYDRGYLVPLKDMRLDLNLRSTYFKVEQNGNVITLRGRGNGHRVGFCQEGAMRMGQLGYTYLQMLNFYYQGVQVINYSALSMQAGTN